MGPDDICKWCRHERKWHNPCSICFGMVSKNPKSTPQSRCKGFAEKVGPKNG